MQKIWICGAKGQIGQAINEIIDKLEFKVLDTDIGYYRHGWGLTFWGNE